TKLNLRPSFLPFYCHAAHEHLHSFPTRRSSDLYRHYGVRPPGGRRTGEQEPQRGTDADRRVSGEESPTAQAAEAETAEAETAATDRKSTRLNSSHVKISYAVFCLKKKTLHQC